ncbi:MAG: M16 family metallopeptidase, partial [Acidobacteriota bacterium]
MPSRPPSPSEIAFLLIAALGWIGRAEAAPGVPRTRVLPNGLTVVTLEDHTLPLVAASLWVRAGSKYETDSSYGYAHYLEHLIQRGSDEGRPFEYQRLAKRWGGSILVRSDYDRTSLTATGVPGALEPILRALAGMALRADLSDSEIDAELGTLNQEMKNYYDDALSVTFLESMRAAFPGHPYRIPMLGSFRTLGRLKRGPLAAFYANLYAPNNMAIALAGDFEPRRASALVDSLFGTARRSATLPPAPDPPAGFPGHADIEKSLDLSSAMVALNFVGPGFRHPDRPGMEVLARALSDDSIVPLTRALVRSGSAEGVRVGYRPLEDAALLSISVRPATPQLSYAAAAAVLQEVVTFKERGLAEDRLRALVGSILGGERVRAELIAERAARLGEAALFGGARYYWDLPETYGRLTPGEVSRVARKYLVQENLRLVVLLPKGAGSPPDEHKASFHTLLDRLGSAGAATNPGFGAARYASREATQVTADAWGRWRDAARPDDPVRTVLDNGLIVVIKEDHRHSLAAASLQLPFGSGSDPAGRAGLASLAGLVLRAAGARGEARRPDGRGLGAPFEVQVSRDLTELRLLSAPAVLERGLRALATAVRGPRVTEEILARARALARRALDRLERDPGQAAIELFREHAYHGHPYAHPTAGSARGLAAITAEDVSRFLRGHLVPHGTVLAVVGAVDRDDLSRLAGELFGDWEPRPDGPRETPQPQDEPPPEGSQPGEYVRLMDAPRSRAI